MREPYKKPEIYVVEIGMCTILAQSRLTINSDSKGDFDEDFVRGHRGRGTWGNLWEETDKTKD